jgi:hypothetical protein
MLRNNDHKTAIFKLHDIPLTRRTPSDKNRKVNMNDDVLANSSEPVRGNPFQKGRSGNPAGRRPGSRNKATLAAAKLLAGEAEGLTRKAVEVAFAGDPMALRLCVERLLPVCRERVVKFKLPPIESPADIAAAMKGGHRGAGRWRDHAGRGGQDRGNGRHLHPGDRHERFRAAPAGTRREVKAGRCRPNEERRLDLALQPIGEIPLLICCRLQRS